VDTVLIRNELSKTDAQHPLQPNANAWEEQRPLLAPSEISSSVPSVPPQEPQVFAFYPNMFNPTTSMPPQDYVPSQMVATVPQHNPVMQTWWQPQQYYAGAQYAPAGGYMHVPSYA